MDVATSSLDNIYHTFKVQPIIRRSSLVDPIQEQLIFKHDISPIIQKLLQTRGICAADDMDYAATNLLPPDQMKGLPEAVKLLKAAIHDKKHVVVVGDFDVDGATSVAVALRGLQSFGLNVSYFIPDRQSLGYGLSPAVVDAVKSMAPDIVLTVDNGIASVAGVTAAQAQGWQVIITDHHLQGDQLPTAEAIVNPNQHGCTFASKHLAGVGVMFYVLIALRAAMRAETWYTGKLPNLGHFLDLVALGTVADLVPLDANNRRLVALGLTRMQHNNACPGLQALAEVAGRSLAQLTESDLGFSFGPRLNAAGRIDDMSHGVECLLAPTFEQALPHAQKLNQLNQQRQGLQKSMQAEAELILDAMKDSTHQLDLNNRSVCIFQSNWHQGIVGLLASRLKDRWYRPVIVFAQSADANELKGSGRSIPGVHLRDILDIVSKISPDIILKFGGHAMAAGLTIRADLYQEFQNILNRVLAENTSESLYKHQLITDGELFGQELSLNTAQAIEQSGPWGQAFPEPCFDGVFEVLDIKWLKEKHLKLSLVALSQDSDEINQHFLEPIDGLFFNPSFDKYHPNPENARCILDNLFRVKIVYRLNINRFRGKENLQLMIDYLEPLEDS